MYSFFLYIIQVSLTLAAFYLFYKLLCSRDTLHRSNRVLLLVLLILSAVIPFIYVDLGMDNQEANAAFEELTMTIEPGAVLVGAYLIGLVVCLVRFASSLLSIVRLIRGSQCQALPDGTILVTHTKDYSPFSWMRYIIVSEHDLRDNRDVILAHERAHIRLGHSWDLLFAQFCATMQWFNPTAWLLKRELEAIHEYEADSDTLRQGFDARQYQLRLFEAAAGVTYSSFTNNFTNCSTKKRIIMMMKKQTSPWALLKALYVLPVAFAAVAVISCTSPKEKKDSGHLSNVMVHGDNLLLVFTFEDSTELNIQGQKLNYNGMPDFDYLKPCGLTPENINSIAALQGEEAQALYGERGSNGAVLFGVKGKTAKEVFSSLSDYAVETGSEEPLKVNLKRPAGIQEIQVVSYKSTSANNNEEQGEIFQVVEEMPEYPGGMDELMKYMQTNIRYPKEAQERGLQGRVIVQFVVNEDGSICNEQVVKSVDPQLDAEAIRIIRSMPNWTPGKQRGEPVRVRFTLPVTFRLQ